jgi:pyruvyltransferase
MAVEFVHWNPRRPVRARGWARTLPIRRRVNNFGDLIGPVIVDELLRRCGFANTGSGRIVTVGSIMHLTRPGDVVWGTGVNGKEAGLGGAPDLDIRAVRGPRTRERLLSAGVARVPQVYGDPALLWGRFWPRERYLAASAARHAVTVIPNFNDWPRLWDADQAVDPRGDLYALVGRIARSELVVGSSSHGIILAEAFGVPARLVASGSEPILKYADYYEGTGRPNFAGAATVREAIDAGGEPPPRWDPEPLERAFPWELFRAEPY